MRKELFALAGAVMLTGCTQYVMQDRYYVDLPGTAPEGAAAMAPAGDAAEFVPEVAELAPAAPAEAPAAPAARPVFEPMEAVSSAPIISEGKKVSSGTVAAVKPGGTYIVKKNDTLGKIAKLHKVKLRDLMAVNNMTEADARKLRIGAKLTIPSGGVKVQPAASSAAASAPAAAAADGTYTIKAGDTPEKIARRFKVKLADLLKVNNMTEADARRLQIGKKLVIPGQGAAPVAVAPAVPAVPDVPEVPAVPVDVPPTVDAPAVSADGLPAPEAVIDLPAAPAVDAPAVDTAVEVIKPPKFQMIEDEQITVGELASRNGVTVEEIGKVNNKPNMSADEVLKKGDYLFVPEK